MNKDGWYEVFVNHGDSIGTETEVVCDTLPEAKQSRLDLIKAMGYEPKDVHIDRWAKGIHEPVEEIL